MASLTEAAKAVLEGKVLDEGYGINYPSVGNGSVSNPNPVDPSTASTGNAKTLRPGSKAKEERHAQNGAGAPGPGDFPNAEDLDGATPTEVADENLGAKAAGKTGKDHSRSSQSSVKAEPMKKLSMAEEMEDESDVVAEAEEAKPESVAARIARVKKAAKCSSSQVEEESEELEEETLDEEIELSEELEAFVAEAIEAGLSEEEILAAIDENFELVTEEEELEESAVESYQVDMSEHVNALLDGEDLSEEFHAKATTIFEAAVKAKLEEEVALLEQAYAETLEEKIGEIQEQLASDIDNYLNYVVEQWIEANEVAIESNLRSELTENFIGGLKALFAEHYIDVPEEEVAVVEELSQAVEVLESKLNEEIQRNVELTGMLSEARKSELTAYVCEGLTDTQVEKMKTLAEGVTYSNDEDFIEKVSTLRESYFPVAAKNDKVLDGVDIARDPQMIKEEATSDLQGPMANYVKALGRSLPK